MVEIYSRNKNSVKVMRAEGDVAERKSIAHLKKQVGKIGKESNLTSLVSFPKQICFEAQDKDEVVVLFMRQHLIVNLPWIILVLFLLTLPPWFDYFPPFSMLPTNFQLVVRLGFYLLVFGIALAKIMSWFFNIYIVTDERIVDIDFVNLFYRVISTAKIDEIQDLSIVESGVWETFYNYGTVQIQTAAEVSQFEFARIPHPDKVGKLLNQMIDLEEQEKLEGRVK